jgi:hypothetical protein
MNVARLRKNKEYISMQNFSDETSCKTFTLKTKKVNLTFRGPCIVIYSYNKTNEMH